MSKVVKSVSKAFRKVTKSVGKAVKRFAPAALAVGALVFTGGAALGLAPMAGGWGAAASAITSKLGAGGVLSQALTGAMTQAGYGALAGGALAGVTGGSVTRGMQMGAVTGAATGGLMGGLGMQTDPFAGIGERGAEAAATEAAGQAVTGQAGGGPATQAAMGQAGAEAATQTATQAGGGGLLGQGGWLERNQQLAGHVIRGVGQGFAGMAQADSERDAWRERRRMEQDQRDWITGNYQGADPSAGFRMAAPGTSGQTPTQRFDPKVYGQFEYRFDPASGRIVRVPIETA